MVSADDHHAVAASEDVAHTCRYLVDRLRPEAMRERNGQNKLGEAMGPEGDNKRKRNLRSVRCRAQMLFYSDTICASSCLPTIVSWSTHTLGMLKGLHGMSP